MDGACRDTFCMNCPCAWMVLAGTHSAIMVLAETQPLHEWCLRGHVLHDSCLQGHILHESCLQRHVLHGWCLRRPILHEWCLQRHILHALCLRMNGACRDTFCMDFACRDTFFMKAGSSKLFRAWSLICFPAWRPFLPTRWSIFYQSFSRICFYQSVFAIMWSFLLQPVPAFWNCLNKRLDDIGRRSYPSYPIQFGPLDYSILQPFAPHPSDARPLLAFN